MERAHQPDPIFCICGAQTQPHILSQGEGWQLFWLCTEHPGPWKPSSEAYPLPEGLCPPVPQLVTP